MKELDKYLKNQLVKDQEEEITRAIFKSHFDEKLKKRWAKELEMNYNVSAPSPIQSNSTSSYRKWILLAASVILGLISVFLYQSQVQPTALQLTDGYLAKKYTHIGLKKGIEIDDIRIIAIDAYNTNDYPKAITLYQKIIASEENNIEDFFFCGLAYLYSNQSEKAVPLFQKGLTMPPSLDLRSKEILRWYLALAYIKSDRSEEAKRELEIITSSSGTKQKAAEKLLKSFQ